VNNILCPFFAKLTEEEKLHSVFQQDSAIAHITLAHLVALQEVFSDHIIDHGPWTLKSLDLPPCDFYLWGNFKDKVYKTYPHTLQELGNNIC
jgi:hypothetical protein